MIVPSHTACLGFHVTCEEHFHTELKFSWTCAGKTLMGPKVLRKEVTLVVIVEVKEERAYRGKLEEGHIHHPLV